MRQENRMSLHMHGPLTSALTRMTLSRGTLDILLTEQRDGLQTTILFQTLHNIHIT